MALIINTESFNGRRGTTILCDDGSTKHVEIEQSVYITEEIPADESVPVEIGFEVYKAREDAQLVSGWANVSINADGSRPLDWQDDLIEPSTLEKAAIQFMLDYRESGVMHANGPVGTVVESIVLTKEKQEALGIPEGIVPQGWFITVKVHDPEVFAKVKDGTYRMFSIQGTCRRVKLD